MLFYSSRQVLVPSEMAMDDTPGEGSEDLRGADFSEGLYDMNSSHEVHKIRLTEPECCAHPDGQFSYQIYNP